MSEPKKASAGPSLALLALPIACCALPLAVVGIGVLLVAVGAPALVAAGIAVSAVGGYVLARRARRRRGVGCCSPQGESLDQAPGPDELGAPSLNGAAGGKEEASEIVYLSR